MLKNNKGFTLIELLIVIVIIGILAGVLVAIINPEAQQNRAKDAGVQATLNKVALAAEGFASAYGRAPNGAEFAALLDHITVVDCQATNETCLFTVTGNELSLTCDGAGGTQWKDSSGTAPCYYMYSAEDSLDTDGDGLYSSHFRVMAKSFGVADTVFVYDNDTAKIEHCTITGGVDVIDTSSPGSDCDGSST